MSLSDFDQHDFPHWLKEEKELKAVPKAIKYKKVV